MKPLISKKSDPLRGAVKVPGDKSISHRAVMFGGITVGETIISGLLQGEDVLHTAAAMRAMGAKIEMSDDGLCRIHGVGLGGLQTPNETLEMGNSGTSTRLLMGLVGGHHISARFTGDSSLTKRPMQRVITPLEMMGVRFESSKGGRLPLAVHGPEDVLAIEYELPKASAQVKSAILLAGMLGRGKTTVIENAPTRDHTEKMLAHFGVNIDVEDLGEGRKAISIVGEQELQPCAVDVPADPSSAAFPAVAALLREGSEITLSNVCVNPTRTGLYVVLKQMGADIEFAHERIEAGEPVADIVVRGTGPLKGIDVDPAFVPVMIDEFPILAMIAACAEGTTKMTGLAELRVKESDRLLMVAQGLEACGVSLEMGENNLTIHGTGKPPKGGAQGSKVIETALDHRIAMSFLVLGSATDEPITVDDGSPINTSFPGFVALMNDLGTDIS